MTYFIVKTWFLWTVSEIFFSNSTDENPQDGELQRLPKSLLESVEALEKDTVLENLIGEKLLVAIKGVRKVHISYLFLKYRYLVTDNLKAYLRCL